jgi:hypothetical protein
MENSKVPEVRRKRGRPPLNRVINGNAPKYHLKAPQQDEAPKAVFIPTDQVSPTVGMEESVIERAIDLTQDVKKELEEKNDVNVYAAEKESKDAVSAIHDLVFVDQIEFVNGKNTLKIVLSKRHNRMYRVQVFLNDTMEIRPATYTGFSPASTFWGFLKEITK